VTHPSTSANSTTKPVTPILQQVRAEAARDALQASRALEHDGWNEEGRVQGLREAEAERRRWGRFCFLCGIAASALFYGLVLS
jgi:hypothetical protein